MREWTGLKIKLLFVMAVTFLTISPRGMALEGLVVPVVERLF